jgi:hypothetical protein
MRQFAIFGAFSAVLLSGVGSSAGETRFTCGGEAGIYHSVENPNSSARLGFDFTPGQTIFVVADIPDILIVFQDGSIRSVKSGIVPSTVSMSTIGSSIRFEVNSQDGDSETHLVMRDGDRVSYVSLIARTRSKLLPRLALMKGDCR